MSDQQLIYLFQNVKTNRFIRFYVHSSKNIRSMHDAHLLRASRFTSWDDVMQTLAALRNDPDIPWSTEAEEPSYNDIQIVSLDKAQLVASVQEDDLLLILTALNLLFQN